MSIYKELFFLEAQRIHDELITSGVDQQSAFEIAWSTAMTTSLDSRLASHLSSLPTNDNQRSPVQ